VHLLREVCERLCVALALKVQVYFVNIGHGLANFTDSVREGGVGEPVGGLGFYPLPLTMVRIGNELHTHNLL
jgi:hypothetical protein